MGLLTAKEAAQHLHVSLFTLGRIEKEGLLLPFRTPGGHRRYSVEMLSEYLEHSRSPSPQPQARVLIVDDGNETAESLARALPSCCFATAQDELHVGIKLAEFKPDLVLVNTGMRDMDGQGLRRRLNGQNQHLKALPFDGKKQVGTGDAVDLDGLRTSIVAALGLAQDIDAA